MQPSAPISQHNTLGDYVRANLKSIIVVVVIGLLALSVIYQMQANHKLQADASKQTSSTGVATGKNEAQQLTAKVGALFELPTTETPTVATVQDPSKLKNQTFFANAKAGDKVLMFGNAKEVILYRPSTNKIVQVAPINLGSGATASSTLSAGQ